MSEAAETVVFLGTLTTAPYAIHTAQAKSFGFTVDDKITEFTNYVVCGKEPGARIDEARKLSLNVLNEEEWEVILIEREKNAKTVNKRRRKKESDDNKGDNNEDDLEIKLSSKTVSKKRLRKSDSYDNIEDVDANSEEDNFDDKPITYMVAKTRFWEIRLEGRETYIRTGKVGERGLTTMKEHKTWTDARDSMTSLIERKLSQGFTKQSKQVDNDDGDGNSKKQERRRYNKKPKTNNDETNTTLLDDGIDTSASESVISCSGESYDQKNYTSSKKFNNTSKKPRVLPPSFANASVTSIMSGNKPGVLLANTWKSDVDPTGWWISEKLDGVRAFWCGKQGKFFSRLGNVYEAPDW